MTQPIRPKAFISYKRDDVHDLWVSKFAADLRAAGIDAILDKWEVRLGDSFTDYMTSRIGDADFVLFIMTDQSVAAVEAPGSKGGAVKFEIQMATSRRTAGEDMRLIGIYRQGNKTAAHLRDHRYADFRDDSRYSVSLRELVNDLLGVDPRPRLAFLLPNDPGARVAAIRSLGSMESHAIGSADMLIRFFADDHPAVRMEAMKAVAAMGPAAIPLLIEALDDGQELVKALACKALGRNGPRSKAAVPKLVHLLMQDPSPNLRAQAAYTLLDLAPETEEAIPALIHALTTEDLANTRRNACAALGALAAKANAAVASLIGTVLEDREPTVRSLAIDALARIAPKNPMVIDAWRKASGDEDDRVRNSANAALRGEVKTMLRL